MDTYDYSPAYTSAMERSNKSPSIFDVMNYLVATCFGMSSYKDKFGNNLHRIPTVLEIIGSFTIIILCLRVLFGYLGKFF